jgi:hypothetical protein
MFSSLLSVAVIAVWLGGWLQSVGAHTVLTYPGWRGDNLVTNDTFPYGMQWMYPCEYFSRLASTGREGMKREEADGHGTKAGIEEQVELFCSAALQCKLADSLFLLAAELGHCLTPPPRGEAVGLLCFAVHCKLHSLPPFDSSRKALICTSPPASLLPLQPSSPELN